MFTVSSVNSEIVFEYISNGYECTYSEVISVFIDIAMQLSGVVVFIYSSRSVPVALYLH
jgi:hypothetical protein